MLLPSGRPGKVAPHSVTGPWKARLLLCIRTGWLLAAAPVLRGFASQDTNAGNPHIGKALWPSMATGPSRGFPSERQEVPSPDGADESNASMSLLMDS